jgi:hypothetical protein
LILLAVFLFLLSGVLQTFHALNQIPSGPSKKDFFAPSEQHAQVSDIQNGGETNNNHDAFEESYKQIPDWMKQYFRWHQEQRELLRKENSEAVSSMRFLLMECWSWNSVCGGTADRLRSIPFMIMVAHRTQRLLLIKWSRPAELEEFLLPPRGGLDWRVPSWLIPHLANRSSYHAATRIERLVTIASLQNETVITTRLQSHDHGSAYYNDHRQQDEPILRDVYKHIWNVVFTPVPRIVALIQEQLQALHLMPGEYAAAHVRALYLEVDRKPEQLQSWAENAVNCASMLRPGGPIFFASDSYYATEMALKYGKTKGLNTVVARSHNNNNAKPLHLDKTERNSQVKASDFYDTFVDLYLLGMSRCLTYNIGGYGKWGLLLGYNSSCGMRHQKGYGFKRDGLAACHWESTAAGFGATHQQKNSIQLESLFTVPMD